MLSSKNAQFLIAVAIVVAMPLLMKSGSLASEVLIFAMAAMACNLLRGYCLSARACSLALAVTRSASCSRACRFPCRWRLPVPC